MDVGRNWGGRGRFGAQPGDVRFGVCLDARASESGQGLRGLQVSELAGSCCLSTRHRLVSAEAGMRQTENSAQCADRQLRREKKMCLYVVEARNGKAAGQHTVS